MQMVDQFCLQINSLAVFSIFFTNRRPLPFIERLHGMHHHQGFQRRRAFVRLIFGLLGSAVALAVLHTSASFSDDFQRPVIYAVYALSRHDGLTDVASVIADTLVYTHYGNIPNAKK